MSTWMEQLEFIQKIIWPRELNIWFISSKTEKNIKFQFHISESVGISIFMKFDKNVTYNHLFCTTLSNFNSFKLRDDYSLNLRSADILKLSLLRHHFINNRIVS